MLPSILISMLLLIGSQFIFLRMSFFEDLGFGVVGNDLTINNYYTVFTDKFYYDALWLTIKISIYVTIASLLISYPVAYILTRIGPKASSAIISAIVASTLVAEVIKVLGLVVLFSSDGIINTTLMNIGIISRPLQIIATYTGIVVGMLYFTVGFMVLSILTVLQTIPVSLEEAAQSSGASKLRTFVRVTFPLSLPGVFSSMIVIFNMSMGAFTAVSLLGGGKILTIPVLIERTIIMETKYGMASTLAAFLLMTVFIINIGISLAVAGRQARRNSMGIAHAAR